MDQLGRWLVTYVESSPGGASALFSAMCLILIAFVRQRFLVARVRKLESKILRLERELAIARAKEARRLLERLNAQTKRSETASDDNSLDTKAKTEQKFGIDRVQAASR